MVAKIGFIFQAVGLLLVASGGPVSEAANPHYVYREDWRETGCGAMLHKVRHQMVPSTTQPPDIRGQWVSTRCEIRSGPEYVIRYFQFTNSTFHSLVYHYSDPTCHKPRYAIETEGTHRLLQPSWTVQGATEASYEVLVSHVIPYSKNVSQQLARNMADGCQDLDAYKRLRPFSRHLIYRAPPPPLPHSPHPPMTTSSSSSTANKSDDAVSAVKKLATNPAKATAAVAADLRLEKNCFQAFNFSLHELQLILVQQKKHHNRYQHPHHRRHRIPHKMAAAANRKQASRSLRENHVTRELLLGAVHSKPDKRQTHRPSSFQTPLKDASTPGCGLCSRITSSGPLYPPRLSTHTGTMLSLEGQWVSTRCESRQYGMFLTRWLKFLPDGSSWQGQYDYYHDPVCHQPSFSLMAKGSYVGGSGSQLVDGAKDYSFKVTRLKVKPHDLATANSMNHYSGKGCGKAHGWRVGSEQDVTYTDGCVTLGIRLPNMERDIMKMEIVHRKLHLFVGQRLVDRKPGAYRRERPTAFQEALVKCDDENLDMSVNTAPGGHAWAGGVALPLASAPDNLVTYGGNGCDAGSRPPFAFLVFSLLFAVVMSVTMVSS